MEHDSIDLRRYPHEADDDTKNKKLRKNAKMDPSESTELCSIYENIEKRKITENTYRDEADELHGLYSANLLACTTEANDEFEDEEIDDYNFDENEERSTSLQLPKDGSIFVNGLPFHHCVLTHLNDKHHQRLLKNGIEISNRRFSSAEDAQIQKNWKEYASRYEIHEEDTAAYMGCAAKKESTEERAQRLKFMQKTHFRPWMCKRLLNRTCIQVFRRCYHLFRNDRKWLQEDDELLLELYNKYDGSWEQLSTEMGRTRYACRKRYEFLLSGEQTIEYKKRKEWTNSEIVRLYLYISQSLETHPVFVATEPNCAKYEEKLQWDPEKMNLPYKTVQKCQSKWEEIKTQFRETRTRLNTDIAEDVERAVFPNSRLLCGWMARQQIRMPLSCNDLVKSIEELLAQCADENVPLIDRISIIDIKLFSKRLSNMIVVPFEVENPAERVLRRIGYILKICQHYKVFDLLPVNHRDLEVKLKAIVYFLKCGNSFKIMKRKLFKYVRRFVREQGWQVRSQIVLVDRHAKSKQIV